MNPGETINIKNADGSITTAQVNKKTLWSRNVFEANKHILTSTIAKGTLKAKAQEILDTDKMLSQRRTMFEARKKDLLARFDKEKLISLTEQEKRLIENRESEIKQLGWLKEYDCLSIKALSTQIKCMETRLKLLARKKSPTEEDHRKVKECREKLDKALQERSKLEAEEPQRLAERQAKIAKHEAEIAKIDKDLLKIRAEMTFLSGSTAAIKESGAKEINSDAAADQPNLTAAGAISEHLNKPNLSATAASITQVAAGAGTANPATPKTAIDTPLGAFPTNN